MKPYASLIVPPEDLALFTKIERIVQEMPEVELGKDGKGEKILVSCHTLVRALARFFPVECQDGHFGNCEHSWLITRTGLIIDPCPVAVVGGPILVDTRFMPSWLSLYEKYSLPKLKGVRFLKNVDKVTEVVRQTMVRLEI